MANPKANPLARAKVTGGASLARRLDPSLFKLLDQLDFNLCLIDACNKRDSCKDRPSYSRPLNARRPGPAGPQLSPFPPVPRQAQHARVPCPSEPLSRGCKTVNRPLKTARSERADICCRLPLRALALGPHPWLGVQRLVPSTVVQMRARPPTRRFWRCCLQCSGLFNQNRTAVGIHVNAELCSTRAYLDGTDAATSVGSSVAKGICDPCVAERCQRVATPQ
jgi:hypothetical protein